MKKRPMRAILLDKNLTEEDEDVQQVVLDRVPPRPEYLLRNGSIQKVLPDNSIERDGSHLNSETGLAGLKPALRLLIKKQLRSKQSRSRN